MKFIIDEVLIKGHSRYLQIMDMIGNSSIDVSNNSDFQKAFSGYYFPAQIKQEFKDLFFCYMQQCRNNCPTYRDILLFLYDCSGDVHYSFASKLLHTIDPNNPILDRHVMRLLGFEILSGRYIKKDDPQYQRKKSADAQERIAYYKEVFDTVTAEYKNYEKAPFMIQAIDRFDDLFTDYRSITYMKKVDMLLFRLRDNRGVSVLDYLNETAKVVVFQ